MAAKLAVLPLVTAVAREACEKLAACVSSTALVRYRTNDYLVPTTYVFQDMVVKEFIDEAVILCGGEEIARHPRFQRHSIFCGTGNGLPAMTGPVA